MTEVKEFVEDDKKYTTPKTRNKRLIQVLNDEYLDEEIVQIERIEISASGWRVTYRT